MRSTVDQASWIRSRSSQGRRRRSSSASKTKHCARRCTPALATSCTERTTNNAGIWAVPFSLSTLETTGEPFLISAQSALPSVSRDGTLLFLPQAPTAPLEMLTVDANGKVLATIGQPKVGLREPRLSPDGRHVAVGAIATGRCKRVDLRRDARGTNASHIR